MNPLSNITFEERVERYKKWSVEELARELAVRDLSLFEPVRIPLPDDTIFPGVLTVPNSDEQFYTTCSTSIHRDKDC